MKFFQNHKRIPLYIGIGLLLVCLVMVPIGTTLAKYVSTLTPEQPYTPTGFYFTSDLLTENGASYTLQNDVDSITVTLKNYADASRISGVDISYTVKIEKTGSTASPETQTGTFTANQKKDAPIVFDGLSVGHYTVTATTSAPYRETLTASFYIPTESTEWGYEATDSGNVVYLRVWSTGYTTTLDITVPTGLLPDNTDPLMRDATSSISLDLKPHTDFTLTFFKENPNTSFYTSSFNVVEVN